MDIDVPMFFGFVGLFTLLMFWPGLVVLHLTGIESFTLPSKIEWIYLCISALVTAVICQLLWLWASLATSPLQGILALALIVPGSKGISNILEGQPLSLKFAAGAALTLISYIGVCNTNRSPRQTAAKVEAFELELR
ncbi:Oidioi.mRNA.OKI2018_I69.PAR.g10482.t1.cds [Oikopleura dioica]|uniref:Oidioi.mRNA.OKI2018_I69.PAR.g10482.t1.cds n=1 Tax=Oikopleura dioica TaxID=34765 RepID=A0ABN7RTX0_OIKDI|nr:Oidioi.mRNA.OKI2018_I69.PAR.g10482.t1.cds [Oikopleura dioica]